MGYQIQQAHQREPYYHRSTIQVADSEAPDTEELFAHCDPVNNRDIYKRDALEYKNQFFVEKCTFKHMACNS